MPDRRAILQFSLLLLALPTQYLISRLYSTSAGQRSTALKEFMSVAVNFHEKYLSWRIWHQWCLEILTDIKIRYSNAPFKESMDVDGETPAVEVFYHRNHQGHFASSIVLRSPRSSNVKFSIGQVVRHKTLGYRGVIIGWDFKPQVPNGWLELYDKSTDIERLKSSPFYAILIDTRDISQPSVAYTSQTHLSLIARYKVQHPKLDDYMDSYEGMRYVPRPWMRVVYPHD